MDNEARLYAELEARGIAFEVAEHHAVFTVDESRELNTSLPGAHTKNLFLKDNGSQYWLVTAPGGAEGFDALISNVQGVVLAVSVADCTPILVYDAKQKAVAAVHAGWRGTAASILRKTLLQMQEQFGTSGADCYAYVGTCIDECSFEVGDEVADAFDPGFKRWDMARQKFFVDLKKANAAQLLDFGVPVAQIDISAYSTVLHNADYFSHRKEMGLTGRMMAVIGMR